MNYDEPLESNKSLSPEPRASAPGQDVDFVTDQKGNRNGKDGIESHPIVVTELHAKLHG